MGPAGNACKAGLADSGHTSLLVGTELSGRSWEAHAESDLVAALCVAPSRDARRLI